MRFDEGNVKRIEDKIGRLVPKAIGFAIRSVANECARERSGEQFWIMCGDECECLTADLTEMGETRFVAVS